MEVFFFEYGQEPDVALLDEDPHVSELYHGDVFKRVEIPGRPGGAKAHWTVVVAYPDGERSAVILENEAGTYRRQLEGARMVFLDVPAGSMLRVRELGSQQSVARRLLLSSMVPPKKLNDSVCKLEHEQPLQPTFLRYQLEDMNRGY